MALKHFFAQKAFVTHGDRLLMVQKSTSDPNHPGKWEVPGGRLEDCEELDCHIQREVREEVGLTVKVGNPFALWQWSCKVECEDGLTDARIVAVARLCSLVSGEATIKKQVEGDHLSDVKWIEIASLLDYNVIPNMRPALEDFVKLTAADNSKHPSTSFHARQVEKIPSAGRIWA